MNQDDKMSLSRDDIRYQPKSIIYAFSGIIKGIFFRGNGSSAGSLCYKFLLFLILLSIGNYLIFLFIS